MSNNTTLHPPLTGTVASMQIANGGIGYVVNDVLTIIGGSGTPATIKVNTVAAGGVIVSAYCPLNFGAYSIFPTNPVAVSGGSGTGATFYLTQGVENYDILAGAFTINGNTSSMNPNFTNSAPYIFRTSQFSVDAITRCTYIYGDSPAGYDGGSGFGPGGAPALIVTGSDAQALDVRNIPIASIGSTPIPMQTWTAYFPTGATLADGFGIRLIARMRPILAGVSGSLLQLGRLDFVRDGADTSSRLNIIVFNAAVSVTALSITHDGTIIGCNKPIQAVADPVGATDVATKNYVDTKLLTPNTGTVTASSGSTTITPGINGLVKVACNLSSTYTLATAGAVDGQRMLVQFRQDVTGSRTVAFDSTVAFGTDIPTFTATITANKLDLVTFIFNSTLNKWMLTAVVKGF